MLSIVIKCIRLPIHIISIDCDAVSEDHLRHGTMLAGIIALYGPLNVKIINLQVYMWYVTL